MEKPYECCFVVVIVLPEPEGDTPLQAECAGVFASDAEAQIVFDNVLAFADLVAKQKWRFDFTYGCRLQHQIAADPKAMESLTVAENRAVITPALAYALKAFCNAFDSGKWKGVEKWMITEKWLTPDVKNLLAPSDETPDVDAESAVDGAPGDLQSGPTS